MKCSKLTHLNEIQERSENRNKTYKKYGDLRIGASTEVVRQKQPQCFWSNQKAGGCGE